MGQAQWLRSAGVAAAMMVVAVLYISKHDSL
jgi:hypothetical protein